MYEFNSVREMAMGRERPDIDIIGIVGTRSRDTMDDEDKVLKVLIKVYTKDAIICSGGCGRGGDRFAKMFHHIYEIPYLEFPAKWKKFGKKAGFIRNTFIAEWSDILIACVSEDSVYKNGTHKSGTEDTIGKWLEFHNGDKSKLFIV